MSERDRGGVGLGDGPLERRQFLQTASAIGIGSIAGVGSVQGQQGSSTEIEVWEDLDSIRDDLGSNYVLVTDLDTETDGYDDLVGDPDEGWTPIGDQSNPFTGTLDGGGYEIADLRIDRPDENNVGLFGETDEARIVDLSATDAEIIGGQYSGTFIGDATTTTMVNLATTGEVRGSEIVGGIAGRSDDLNELRNSQTSQTVNGDNRVGGLVGEFAEGDISNSHTTGSISGGDRLGGLVGLSELGATITNSYATGPVEGSDSYVGGLVGIAADSSIFQSYATGTLNGEYRIGGALGASVFTIVTESFATGTVNGENSIGGLIGIILEGGEVIDSYATGSVSGTEEVGGLVGFCEVSGAITNSYAVGSVSGTEFVGGLIGYVEFIEPGVINSYWDISATGKEDTARGGRGFGELDEEPPAEEMTGDDAEENMVGFDFDKTWKTVVDPADYPRLQWQESAESPLEPYANENDVVETSGLLAAIDDWRAGEIETTLLLDVIDAWRTGEPIS